MKTNIIKVDVSGMYPTIIHDFNIHQLTTRFTSWSKLKNPTVRDMKTGAYIVTGDSPGKAIRELEDGSKFVCNAHSDIWLSTDQIDRWRHRLLYKVPIDISELMPDPKSRTTETLLVTIDDESVGKTAKVEIDMSEESIYRKEIREMKAARSEIQARAREIKRLKVGLDELPMLRSREYALKVIMNKKFGYSGLREAMYSDFSVAMTIVNIAQLIIRYIISYGMELGMDPIEVDTDGVFFDKPVENAAAKIGAFVQDKIREYCYGNESTISLSTDEYFSIYMYSTKNYALMDTDGKVELHGVAFKSSRYSRVFSSAVRSIAEWVLLGECEGTPYSDINAFTRKVYHRLMSNLDSLPLNYFRMSISLKKNPSEYTAGKMETKLAAAAAEHTKTKIVAGDQLFYYYVGDGKKHPMIASRFDQLDGNEFKQRSMLDMTHYSGEIIKAMERFGLSYSRSTKLSLF